MQEEIPGFSLRVGLLRNAKICAREKQGIKEGVTVDRIKRRVTVFSS
jgi:hypothetical protein